jgi:uncharacterized protein HemY
MKLTYSQFFFWAAILAVDLLAFVILGLLLMGYDDNYDRSKGVYWSLESMNFTEKAIYIVYNFWIFIHLTTLVYLVFKVGKKFRRYFKFK